MSVITFFPFITFFPYVVTPIAFIVVSSLPVSLPVTQEPRREYGLPRERSAWPVRQRHSTPGEPAVVQRSRQPCVMAVRLPVRHSRVRRRRPSPARREGSRGGASA